MRLRVFDRAEFSVTAAEPGLAGRNERELHAEFVGESLPVRLLGWRYYRCVATFFSGDFSGCTVTLLPSGPVTRAISLPSLSRMI